MSVNKHKHVKHVFEEPDQCKYRYKTCYLCKNEVSLEESDTFYCCQRCGFSFHKDCLTVNYPKCHEHTLTFIRREVHFPCDVCGSEDYPAQMYGCLQCDFYVHRHCIYLPKVVKITRHSHRLAHVLIRISDDDYINKNVCGICWKRVDVGYRGYSCIDKTCNYVAHSICIIRSNVWDGKDVEGEPEEEDVDDLAPVLVVKDVDGESIWRHFSHDHDLLGVLEDQDSEELCQACILPTKTGTFLRCKQCDDFALHETCASLPRKMAHGLHLHPLTLHLEPIYTFPGFFTCYVCNQDSSGLMSYKCSHKDCGFIMDVKCASFVEPFNHTALPHDPFYLGINLSSGFIYLCKGCRQFSTLTARCVKRRISFDFKCVNLPEVMKYKSDDHPLTLYYDENNDFEWCEICEEIIEKGLIFYTCHECTTTLHVDCFLGKYPYLKCGHRIKVNGFEVEIASNNGASRPICQTCHRICQAKQVFNGKDELCFCSIKCIPFQASS